MKKLLAITLHHKRLLPLLLATLVLSACTATPESWTTTVAVYGPNGRCRIVTEQSWDDVLPCLKLNDYTAPHREGRRVSHDQVTPDRFIDIWEIYPLWFERNRVRLTFERGAEGPYRITLIETGDTELDKSEG